MFSIFSRGKSSPESELTGAVSPEQSSALLTHALLKNSQAERRFKYFRLAIIVLIAVAYLVFGSFFFAKGSHAPSSGAPHIAVVQLHGVIGPDQDISFDGVRSLLHSAFKDTSAKAVVLSINSPGGSPVQSALIHDELKTLKARYPNKKLVAVGEDYVASGGYFIAVAADELIVNRSTLAGSIGVISSGFGFNELIARLGIERRKLTAGESKGGNDPFAPVTDKERAQQKQLIDSIYVHFTDTVLQARKDKLKKPSNELFTGEVWTGDQAVSLGIADKLGSVSTVMAEVGAERVVIYNNPPPLLKVLSSSLGAGAAQALESAAFRWLMQAQLVQSPH